MADYNWTLELEPDAERLNNTNCYAVRPRGALGTCGWIREVGWEVLYIKARSPAEAIRKARGQVRAPRMRWCVGSNQPGYLPEAEPVAFPSFKASINYLIEGLEENMEADRDDERPNLRLEYQLAIANLKWRRRRRATRTSVVVGSTEYWIAPVE